MASANSVTKQLQSSIIFAPYLSSWIELNNISNWCCDAQGKFRNFSWLLLCVMYEYFNKTSALQRYIHFNLALADCVVGDWLKGHSGIWGVRSSVAPGRPSHGSLRTLCPNRMLINNQVIPGVERVAQYRHYTVHTGKSGDKI